ncbi:TetR family transcriptional regulator [Actinoplanes bogorensis]|uniref:TetR family transcriptional regulator n=1 Tax=Paractinoplanes bogorensis TaxID=1610840 RepID=A0ABS5Z2V3_9ACTN|nr:TetR family transcriptional regulator [Actinoplanes bogorensis]MBU2669274.1 TetR family transcriptional regulator [Actinoplanes bogorensis]
MGLRERKKQQTRTTLSWSAIRLIVERGYDRVLVEDIATEAGVSPRTFNNYFSSKAEAVASRHLDRCLRMADELRARPAGEPLWEALEQAVLSQFDMGPEVAANPPLDREAWVHGLRLMLEVPAIQAETLRAGADAEVALAAAVGTRTGTDPSDLYPRLVAAAVLAAGNVATQLFVAGSGRDVDVRRVLAEALRQLSTGLQPPGR